MFQLDAPVAQVAAGSMSALETIGLYVGLPIALFAVISVLVLAPSWVRGGSYRPGLSWWAAPQWFGARPDPGAEAEVVEARPGVSGGERGGVGARW